MASLSGVAAGDAAGLGWPVEPAVGLALAPALADDPVPRLPEAGVPEPQAATRRATIASDARRRQTSRE